MTTLYTITATSELAGAYQHSNNSVTQWEGDDFVTLAEARKMIADAVSNIRWDDEQMIATFTDLDADDQPVDAYLVIEPAQQEVAA